MARALALLAVLLPALAVGGVVYVATQPSTAASPSASAREDAGKLARRAELAPPSARALIPVSDPGAVHGLQRIGGGFRPATPVTLSIPSADVEAHVQPVGLRGTAIEVPRVGRAGWFEAGPRPGEAGRSVIIGHLDTRTGPGLFARVPGLARGTRVSVTDAQGAVHAYRVVGTAQVPKDRFPVREVFGASDRPVLVLVTCGGDYEPGSGYSDNVVLYARAA